ncbi:MAG: LemA family protein [Xanthomonadales bacterium]|jgi:LemA protein|nr:LemA family protein [Xanthomonadales bacterium]
MEILLFGIVIFGLALAWIYNRLVRQRNIVSAAWSDIDVQLQKRHELVPNLVATVKGYLRHEAEVLEQTTRLRAEGPEDAGAVAAEETVLSRQLGKLFALAEDYPELKASEGFQQLHDSLVAIEDDLQFARRYYNGAVRDNNNLVQSFPVNLVAGPFGFRTADFFEIELASQREAPRVAL